MSDFTLKEKLKHLLSFPVIVAALGYFVDIYDLLLFGIVRVPSLKDLNLDMFVTYNGQLVYDRHKMIYAHPFEKKVIDL